MSWLLEPLGYDFFVRGLVLGVLMGITCGALGCFVVLRGMAFIGDALAHAVLPGVVVAYILGVNVLVGALVAGLLAALLIGAISRTEQVKDDSAIGIVFTSAFALGIVLISRLRGYARDLTHFLFGNILGVSPADVWLSAGIGIVVLVCLGLWYRELLVASFDPTHARAIGLRLGWLLGGLLVLLELTIVAGIQAVGVVLIAALLITPAATARLLTTRLPTMLLLASAIGSAAALVGLYASYYIAVASGGAIVLTATLFFVLALVFAPRKGVLARRRTVAALDLEQPMPRGVER